MSEQTVVDSEVSVADLLRGIIATRVPVLVTLLVVSAGYWAVLGGLNLAKPTVHSFAIRVDLQFSGVHDGRYPNGSTFTPTDIIAPVVLRSVYDVNTLSGYIPFKDFLDAFSVAPYTPARELVLQKYAVAAGGLEQAELDERREQLARELSAISSGSVEIRFTSAFAVASIPAALMAKVLRDVPQEWNRHVTDEVGVVRFNEPMYTASVINRPLIESIDYLIAFEMLLNRIWLLRENIRSIQTIPNAYLVRDEVSSMNLPDLESAINDIEDYQIAPLQNPVRSLGIARDRDVVGLYFRDLLTRLQRNKAVMEAKLGNIKSTYSDYVEYDSVGRAKQAQSASQSNGTMIPQFGAEFIDRIVEMTNAGEDIAYRQELNARQLVIADQLAEGDAEISRVEDILKTLERAANEGKGDAKLRQRYAEQVSKTLPEILVQIKEQFDIAERIMRQLASTRLSKDSVLYQVSDGDTDYSKSGNVLTQNNFRIYLIVAFLTLVVTVPIVMLRNLLR